MLEAKTLEIDLQELFLKVRQRSEDICKPLEIEDYVVQPIFDVSPPKWHLAHVTWFFENFILDKFTNDYKFYNECFNLIFNSYYKCMGAHWYQGDRGHLSRPTVKEVYDYRHHVTKRVAELLAELYAKDDQKTLAELEPILVLGLHHEEQHQELLLTDIKNIYAASPLRPIYKELDKNTPQSIEQNAALSPAKFLSFDKGLYEFGLDDSYDGSSYETFCFDNEKPKHKVFLNAFALQSRPVSNAEFIEFIEDGGYANYAFWLSDAWNWVNDNKIQAPMYWEKLDGEWYSMTMSGFKKVDPNEAVTHVSFYEADAFAKWSGKRLPTEYEWELATSQCKKEGNFLESTLFHPRAMQDSESFSYAFGDVWEWTNSAYLAYPGYKAPEGPYGEYNGKFMNQQRVLKGGSCVSPQDHIRASYRNFFYADKRWQFTGFRLAEDS